MSTISLQNWIASRGGVNALPFTQAVAKYDGDVPLFPDVIGDGLQHFQQAHAQGLFDELLTAIEALSRGSNGLLNDVFIGDDRLDIASFFPDSDLSNGFKAAEFNILGYVDVLFLHLSRNLLNDTEIEYYDIINNSRDYTWIPQKGNIFHTIGDGFQNTFKVVSNDGHQEYIFRHFNGQFELVTDPINAGSYNFQLNPNEGLIGNIAHNTFDIVPWTTFGNQIDDDTSIEDRDPLTLEGLFPWLPDQIDVANDPVSGTANGDLLFGPFLKRAEVFGGDGDDTLTGGRENDTINGGSGEDAISYANSTTGVAVNLLEGFARHGVASYDNLAESLASIENVIGSNFGDIIVGSSASNVIEGGGGNDIVSGGHDRDVFLGSLRQLDGDQIKDLEIGERIVVKGIETLSPDHVNYTSNSIQITGRSGETSHIIATVPSGATLHVEGYDQRLDGVAIDVVLDLPSQILFTSGPHLYSQAFGSVDQIFTDKDFEHGFGDERHNYLDFYINYNYDVVLTKAGVGRSYFEGSTGRPYHDENAFWVYTDSISVAEGSASAVSSESYDFISVDHDIKAADVRVEYVPGFGELAVGRRLSFSSSGEARFSSESVAYSLVRGGWPDDIGVHSGGHEPVGGSSLLERSGVGGYIVDTSVSPNGTLIGLLHDGSVVALDGISSDFSYGKNFASKLFEIEAEAEITAIDFSDDGILFGFGQNSLGRAFYEIDLTTGEAVKLAESFFDIFSFELIGTADEIRAILLGGSTSPVEPPVEPPLEPLVEPSVEPLIEPHVELSDDETSGAEGVTGNDYSEEYKFFHPIEPETPIAPQTGSPLGANQPSHDADIMSGSAENEKMSGLGGNDTMRAGGGDDTMLGGSGDDRMLGQGGDDRLIGQAGNDFVKGNGGDDTLIGGGGDDSLRGNGGNDSLKGGGGNDNLKGGGGDDTIIGNGGADDIKGGGGNDVINAGRGDDTIKGNGGADSFQFRGNDDSDRINGFQQGQDVIEILAGANSFSALDISQDGRNVLIEFANTDITVTNAQVAQFTEDDFLFS